MGDEVPVILLEDDMEERPAADRREVSSERLEGRLRASNDRLPTPDAVPPLLLEVLEVVVLRETPVSTIAVVRISSGR